MSVKTAWRNAEDYPIKPVPGPQKNRIRTAAGSFKVKQAKNALQGCICAAIAERGFLNRETQQIEYEKNDTLTVEVGCRAYNVGIFLASEQEVRLCDSKVAELNFIYADGIAEKHILKSGEQLGGLFRNYAREAYSKVHLDGMRNCDDAVVLWYRTDCDRVLSKIQLKVLGYDCQIALFGINVIQK